MVREINEACLPLFADAPLILAARVSPRLRTRGRARSSQRPAERAPRPATHGTLPAGRSEQPRLAEISDGRDAAGEAGEMGPRAARPRRGIWTSLPKQRGWRGPRRWLERASLRKTPLREGHTEGMELGLRGRPNRTGPQTLIYFASLTLLIGLNVGDAFKNCLCLRSVDNKDNNTNLWLIRLKIQKEKVPREAGAHGHLYVGAFLVQRYVLKAKPQS